MPSGSCTVTVTPALSPEVTVAQVIILPAVSVYVPESCCKPSDPNTLSVICFARAV